MTKMLLALIFALPVFAHANVAADIAKVKADETACMSNASSNVEMKGCSADADDAADRLLNYTYKQVINGLLASIPQDVKDGIPPNIGSTETLKRLQKSEIAWIAFRDANCDYEATEMLGGTGEGLVNSECLVTTTLDRVKELDSVAGANH